MLVHFLDYDTKESKFHYDCTVVPQKGEFVQQQAIDDSSIGVTDYRVLSVTHLLMVDGCHSIVCLVTSPDKYLEFEYGKGK